jgi:hypothetical protein
MGCDEHDLAIFRRRVDDLDHPSVERRDARERPALPSTFCDPR